MKRGLVLFGGTPQDLFPLCGSLNSILWWRILVVFVKLFVLYVLHAGENSLQAQTTALKEER